MAHAAQTVSPDSYISIIWPEDLFSTYKQSFITCNTLICTANKVVFCTGGSGDICSSQVRALVYLGANACIIGRNQQRAESVATNIANVRPGAKVIGLGNVDVRKIVELETAVSTCVSTLGGIDFVM